MGTFVGNYASFLTNGLSSGSVSGSNIAYVDVNGNDGSAIIGNAGNPFKTPQAAGTAIAVARASTVIQTLAIAYSSNVVTLGMTATNTFTSGDIALIQGGDENADNNYQTITVVNANTITFPTTDTTARTIAPTIQDVTTLGTNVIQIGQGTFNFTAQFAPGPKVDVIGVDQQVTKLVSTLSGTAASFLPGWASTFRNLYLQESLTPTVFSVPIGFNRFAADPSPSNVIIQDCTVTAWSDCHYFKNGASNDVPKVYWKFINCTFNSNYDATQTLTTGTWPVTVEFFDCNINVTWDGASTGQQWRGYNQAIGGLGVTYRVFGGTVNCVGGASTGSSQYTSAVHVTAGGTIELHGVNVIVRSNSGTFIYSLKVDGNAASRIKVDPATAYDPTLISITTGKLTSTTPQIIGTTGISIAAGTAASAATLTAGSDDSSGQCTLTPVNLTTGTLATVTFGSGKLTGFPILTPANAAAQIDIGGATGIGIGGVTGTQGTNVTGFTIVTGATGLSVSPIVFNFRV